MQKIGVVLGNLGTPQAPDKKSVGRYLREFLMDRFVIDIAWIFRWLLVNLIIVPFRSKTSAKAYQSIWRSEGSPLMIYSQALLEKMQHRWPQLRWALAMRYGSPKPEQALKSLKDCEKIILAPLYPQYAESSTRTWVEKMRQVAKELGVHKKLQVLPPFYANKHFITAQVNLLQRYLKDQALGKDYDFVLFSYHGLPVRHIDKVSECKKICSQGDGPCPPINELNPQCYRAQCYETSRAIAQQMGFDAKAYGVSFQSRLGRDPWIQPFTDVMMHELPRKGVQRLVVLVPSFVADCLETLEEIADRARQDFLSAGGKSFQLIPCLNADDIWVEQLGQMIVEELQEDEWDLLKPSSPVP